MAGCTVSGTDAPALPPAPLQVSENVLVPTARGETFCDPLAPFAPVQSLSAGEAEAEQESAFVLDHVSVTGFPKITDAADAVSVAVGGGGGALGPPPQPCRSSIATAKDIPTPKLPRWDFIAATSAEPLYFSSPRQANASMDSSDRADENTKDQGEQ